jgi:phosphatidylglycerophosphate synthase
MVSMMHQIKEKVYAYSLSGDRCSGHFGNLSDRRVSSAHGNGMDMVKTAIILAPDERGLQLVYGIPAVRRLVLLAHRSGIHSVQVVGRAKPYLSVLSDLIPVHAFHEAEDRASLAPFVESLGFQDGERVLILRANLVIDAPSIARLIEEENKKKVVLLTGLEKNGPDRLFMATAVDILPMLQALWSGEPLDSKIEEKASRLEGADGLPHAVGQGEGREISERHLLKALAAQTKFSDGFLARTVARRISRFFSKRLAHTRITPNQITMIGVTIGLLGAYFLAQPTYEARLLGALLFLFCVIVDGVDGEVARLKLQETSFGHYLDIVTDNVVHVVLFVAIAFGLYRETGDAGYMRALLFLLAGFVLCAVSVYYLILKREPDELRRSPATLRLMALMTNRDFAYLVVALALVNRLNWFLKGAAVGSFLFAATLWAVTIFGNRAAGDQTP